MPAKAHYCSLLASAVVIILEYGFLFLYFTLLCIFVNIAIVGEAKISSYMCFNHYLLIDTVLDHHLITALHSLYVLGGAGVFFI